MFRQRMHIAFLSQLFDQPCRALDVCEQQGDGAGRKIHTHGSRSSAGKDCPSSPPVPSVGPLGCASVLSSEITIIYQATAAAIVWEAASFSVRSPSWQRA